MSDTTHRIKNLSIALEKVAHLDTPRGSNLFDRIHDLLSSEIAKQEKKQGRKAARPAESATQWGGAVNFINPETEPKA